VTVSERGSSTSRRGAADRRRSWAVAIPLLAIALAIAGVGLPWAVGRTGGGPAATSATECPPLDLYYSRGSGQPTGASPGAELYHRLRHKYGSGEVKEVENPYPAASVTFKLKLFKRESKIPKLRLLQYRRSVAAGVSSELGGISALLAACPKSRLILGGYSQGAQVTRLVIRALKSRDRAAIVAVALFGDPYFNPSEPPVTYFPPGNRLRRGLLVPARAKKIAVPKTYDGRVFSWCHYGDIVCQGPGRNRKGAHGGYEKDVPQVLRRIASLLAEERIRPPRRAFTHLVTGTCAASTCALAAWSGPGTKFEHVGSVADGEQVGVVCQTVGETITGSNGVSSHIWDELDDGTYVSDFYLNTPNVDAPSPPIPSC
jgi:hypothetical protein